MIIDLKKLESGPIRFDETLDFAPLPLDGGQTVGVREARLRGELVRGDDGVDFDGRLDARLALGCSRCLETYELPISVEFQLILVPDPIELGSADAEDDRAGLLFQVQGGKADLKEIAREQIYLQLPLKPICEPGCLGLCPTCGTNRNRLKCGCRTEEPDPRLAPLLEFKKKLGKR